MLSIFTLSQISGTLLSCTISTLSLPNKTPRSLPSWPPFCCGAFWESDSRRQITYQHSSLVPGFLPACLPVSLTPLSSRLLPHVTGLPPLRVDDSARAHPLIWGRVAASALGSCEQRAVTKRGQVSAFGSFRCTPWNGFWLIFHFSLSPSELKLHIKWSATSPPHLCGWRLMN